MIKNIYIILSCILVWASVPSFASKPKHTCLANKTVRILRNSVKHGLTMYGHQDDLMYGREWRLSKDEKEFKQSDTYSVCGAYPMVLGLDVGRIERGGNKNLDQNRVYQMREAAMAHYKRGGIVTISWHCDNPITGESAWDTGDGHSLHHLLESTEELEEFNKWIDVIAEFLKSLKTPSGKLMPVLFRPWHECNLDFWWGGNNVTNEEYIELWKITFNRLVKTHHLKNLIWVYSPYDVQNKEDFMSRYPGDEYVDVFGYERYQGGENEASEAKRVAKFCAIVKNGLQITSELAKEHNKLYAITETGYLGIKYKKWWTEGLLPAIEEFPCVYALTWHNGYGAKNYAGPTPTSESSPDFIFFSESSKVLLLSTNDK